LPGLVVFGGGDANRTVRSRVHRWNPVQAVPAAAAHGHLDGGVYALPPIADYFRVLIADGLENAFKATGGGLSEQAVLARIKAIVDYLVSIQERQA
jgi:hypothetical protein